jgi:hypothetical protein
MYKKQAIELLSLNGIVVDPDPVGPGNFLASSDPTPNNPSRSGTGTDLSGAILVISIADPGSSAFLTPGSGIRDGGKNSDPDIG